MSGRTDFEFFPYREEDGAAAGAGADGGFTIPARLLERAAEKMWADAAFYFTPRHLGNLEAAGRGAPEHSNDRFVLSLLLENAAIASEGRFPLCQDTGVAAVFGFRDCGVRTEGDECAAFTRAARRVYAEKRLRFSTVRARSFFDEYDGGDNLPAQIMLFASGAGAAAGAGGPEPFWEGPSYRFLFCAKGGGSSNKTRLIQGTKALLTPRAFGEMLRAEIRAIGAGACPPYTLALAAGGLSPEENLLALKLASSGWYGSLPYGAGGAGGGGAGAGESGAPFRDAEIEALMMEAARDAGAGAGAGGEAFALEAVAVRLPRHGASFPVSLGVSCSAHRALTAVFTREGWYAEKTARSPRGAAALSAGAALGTGARGAPLRVSTEGGIASCLEALAGVPAGARVLVSGPLLVARDAAHSRWLSRLEAGEGLPPYVSRWPIFYAGPAGTPEGCPCGSIGPTTASRMDPYAEALMSRGAALVTLAKGNRSGAWREASARYGACYLGVPGGCAAYIAGRCAQSLVTLDYADLGMEAVRLLTVKDLPAFVLIDRAGRDFYASLATR